VEKMSDLIHYAVLLADGWEHETHNRTLSPFHTYHDGLAEEALDALAAQLVRQVDAKADNRVKGFYSRPLQADVYWPGLGHKQCGYSITCGDDRTMNTIKAIVDSGVLE